MTQNQEALMVFDPATGHGHPYPSHAAQYRQHCGQVAWLFNPWTGERRDARDVGSDTFGHLVLPPGATMTAAKDAYEAEEYECAMMHLDALGVPRDEDGARYSLAGRIEAMRRSHSAGASRDE